MDSRDHSADIHVGEFSCVNAKRKSEELVLRRVALDLKKRLQRIVVDPL